MGTKVLVNLKRVDKVEAEFKKIIDAYVKTSDRPLKGFVLDVKGKKGQLAECKCQCSITSDCGGGGGGGVSELRRRMLKMSTVLGKNQAYVFKNYSAGHLFLNLYGLNFSYCAYRISLIGSNYRKNC